MKIPRPPSGRVKAIAISVAGPGGESRGKSRFRPSPFRPAGFQPSLHRECASGPAVSTRGIGQRVSGPAERAGTKHRPVCVSGRCRHRSGRQRQPQLDRIEE
ncbi:MAG: hypothetical protein OXD45_02325 [Rhodobacteraceae bacterium]|nr:hypothetical protein [Paracoccaceae bacterium]